MRQFCFHSQKHPPILIHGKMSNENENLNDFVKDETIVTKYKTAAGFANSAIKTVADACIEGAKVLDLCNLGDDNINAQAALVYKTNKGMQKGVAFPTSVSVGNIVCHLSPLRNDVEAELTLKSGDVVRIELGAHVDGYIAQVAQTIVVGATKVCCLMKRLMLVRKIQCLGERRTF
jgi:methionine aminopeptidase